MAHRLLSKVAARSVTITTTLLLLVTQAEDIKSYRPTASSISCRAIHVPALIHTTLINDKYCLGDLGSFSYFMAWQEHQGSLTWSTVLEHQTPWQNNDYIVPRRDHR